MDILRALGFGRKEKAEVNLEGARKLIEEEREKSLKEIYPECAKISEDVRAAFGEIRKDCDLFEQSKAEMDPELRSAVKGITRTMKENFIARMRQAVELGEPPRMEYGQFTAFSKGLQETMAKIAKINSDNRYIFTLYKQDAERFKAPFERATGLSDGLKGLLEKKREEAEEFGKVAVLIEELEGEKERIGELDAEIIQMEGRLIEKRSELAGFGESEQLKGKQEELSKAAEEFAEVSGKIASSITQLERALRKYGRICDPGEKPERYAEAPIAELLKEGDEYPQLKATLERVKKLIEKGELELKNPEKIREQIGWLLEGNLTPLLKRYKGLSEEKERLEKELEPLKGTERGRQALENAVEQLAMKVEKQKKSIEEERAGFEKRKGELREKFKEVVGKEIELKE